MKRDNLPWSQAPSPSLRWNENGVPASQAFDDVYYSQEDGLAESRHVFLEGNELPSRWHSHEAQSFCIFETGFGTGLNFLATWQAWLELPQPRPRLHYIAVEKHPLRLQDLRRAIEQWPELSTLASSLLALYPPAVPGQHRIILAQGKIQLDLWWLDVQDTLDDLAGLQRPLIDAWYLDGFAPARNDAMWSHNVLSLLGPLSRAGATFSTFTAVGQVRRDLAAAGFHVEKRAGFGRKRECLHGRMPDAESTEWEQPVTTPWDLPALRQPASTEAVVIGAGLAGCFTASALARRGFEVTVVESGNVADAGSGNLQGVLYTRLSRRHGALTDFALTSFLYAARYYRELFGGGQLAEGIDGSLCGMFQQTTDSTEMAFMAEALENLPELAQVLGAPAASSMLGISQQCAGYWFPQSGWLNPQAVCRALLADPRIAVLENSGNVTLVREEDQWVVSERGRNLASAPHAVIAAGTGSTAFDVCQWLPTSIIRGQTTQLPVTPIFSKLRATLCHSGYIAPATAQGHCIGASFDPQDTEIKLRKADTALNIERLAEAIPDWAAALSALPRDNIGGRVGWRCASPDYLPMVGPLPDLELFKSTYSGLRRNAKQVVPGTAPYLPGLYLNTGHGSRGLSSTPLAADILASHICNEAPPLERSLGRALAPARFIIRDLMRNRI